MNPHLDRVTLVFTLINCVWAFGAVAMNIWSAFNGPPEAFVIRWCVAALAFLMSIAYAILGLSNILPATWTLYVRGAAAIVIWPVVWYGPPLFAVITKRAVDRGQARMTYQLAGDDG